MNKRPSSEAPEPLALRPREAAIALSVSPRVLWSLTNRGEIPHFHIGRSVLYPVDGLREWVAAKTAAEAVPAKTEPGNRRS